MAWVMRRDYVVTQVTQEAGEQGGGNLAYKETFVES